LKGHMTFFVLFCKEKRPLGLLFYKSW